MYNMVQRDLFNDNEKEMLRKCAVYYSAIGAEHPPKEFAFDNVGKITAQQIKRDLNPVLRRGEHFRLEPVQAELRSYLEKVLIPIKDEELFWYSFSQGVYRPELIFEDGTELINIRNHPMALWKCRDKGEDIVSRNKKEDRKSR